MFHLTLTTLYENGPSWRATALSIGRSQPYADQLDPFGDIMWMDEHPFIDGPEILGRVYEGSVYDKVLGRISDA